LLTPSTTRSQIISNDTISNSIISQDQAILIQENTPRTIEIETQSEESNSINNTSTVMKFYVTSEKEGAINIQKKMNSVEDYPQHRVEGPSSLEELELETILPEYEFALHKMFREFAQRNANLSTLINEVFKSVSESCCLFNLDRKSNKQDSCTKTYRKQRI
jgi:hypothetical protein